MSQFDIVVIGAGPGGYIAAIRAAQLGFKVACIDHGQNKEKTAPALGGTCLKVGCIPSKALLQSSEEFHKVQHELETHGIHTSRAQINIPTMISRKDAIVNKLTNGVAFLFKKNKVESLHGTASFYEKKADHFLIKVNDGKKKEIVKANQVIIASGSKVRSLPNIDIDNQLILDNVGALDLQSVPKNLGVIGAGVIGLEMGTVWQRLGAQVTLLEACDTFLPMADQQIAKEALKIFNKKQGLNIHLGTNIKQVSLKNKQVQLSYQLKGETFETSFDKLIIAIGRTPNTDGLNLEAIGVSTDARGFIEVNENCQTKVKGIWAIGDVVRGPMLAHKASEEGVAVAERIAGQLPSVHLDQIPSIIYTQPELAWVGKTEEQLKKEGVAYKKGLAHFATNGRALAMDQAAGMVKLLADAHTDRLLGAHIIGAMASELISECVTALAYGASSEDIARTIHAHPTLSETIFEAALAVDKRALNS